MIKKGVLAKPHAFGLAICSLAYQVIGKSGKECIPQPAFYLSIPQALGEIVPGEYDLNME